MRCGRLKKVIAQVQAAFDVIHAECQEAGVSQLGKPLEHLLTRMELHCV